AHQHGVAGRDQTMRVLFRLVVEVLGRPDMWISEDAIEGDERGLDDPSHCRVSFPSSGQLAGAGAELAIRHMRKLGTPRTTISAVIANEKREKKRAFSGLSVSRYPAWPVRSGSAQYTSMSRGAPPRPCSSGGTPSGPVG